jgi:DNA-binding response OmpR family regulator
MTTLLLVEDDPSIYDTIAPYVHREGWELRWARSVSEARRSIEERRPDAALIDRGLPGAAGDALAPSLRELNIPFLMLTARAEESERLAGFDLGADDYVTKPFSAAELVRRVGVLLRRQGTPRLKLGADVELDCDAQRMRVNARDVELTATEFALLERLARHPGRVFTRADLATLIGLDLESSERTIDSHVKNIRRKLREAGALASVIETVVGVGYTARSGR